MDVSVITVTHNAKDTIVPQMRSVVVACEGISCEQIIVDNASSDGTRSAIQTAFPGSFVIYNPSNRGFGLANNQGIAVSGGEFVFLLNPDMKMLGQGSMKKFIDWMRAHPDVGIASCLLIKEDGSINVNAAPRRFPKWWEMAVLILKIPHLSPRLLDHYLMRDVDFRQEQEVDSVRGSCMLIRRKLIEQLGGHAFDTRYFIWFEDVDLCREAKRLGWKVVHTPAISCVDLIGQSFKKKKFWWKQWHFTRSMLKYFAKWGI